MHAGVIELVLRLVRTIGRRLPIRRGWIPKSHVGGSVKPFALTLLAVLFVVPGVEGRPQHELRNGVTTAQVQTGGAQLDEQERASIDAILFSRFVAEVP